MALGKGPDPSPLAAHDISIGLDASFPRFRSSLPLRVSITLDNILIFLCLSISSVVNPAWQSFIPEAGVSGH